MPIQSIGCDVRVCVCVFVCSLVYIFNGAEWKLLVIEGIPREEPPLLCLLAVPKNSLFLPNPGLPVLLGKPS